MQELFKFFKGYVIIKITGDFPERFLNLAVNRNIYIWDVRRAGNNVYTMKMSAKAFLELKKVAYISNCRVSVIAKKGFIFRLKSIKNLKAILTGILIFGIVIVYVSGCVTDIYVEGNENLTVSDIEDRLSGYGLKRWVRKSSLDTENIQRLFLKDNDDVSYIAVNLHGTKAYVQVAEAVEKPYVVDADAPCNIVSDKDGIVETLRVKTGFPVVKEGDAVHQGQLLVSGITDSRFLTVRYVNSDAEIVIRTWRDFCREFPLIREIRTKTGNTSTSYRITLWGKTVKKAKTKFDNFSADEELVTDQSHLGITKVKFFEENVIYETLTPEEAFEIYYKEYLGEIKKGLPEATEIVSVRHNSKEDEGKLRIWIELETLEKSGVKQEIKKEETNNGENN